MSSKYSTSYNIFSVFEGRLKLCIINFSKEVNYNDARFFSFLTMPISFERKQKPNPSSNKIRWIIQTLISKEPPHWLWFEKERRDSRATNHLIFVVSNHVTQWIKNFRYATRTRNLMIRSHTLCPVELTGRGILLFWMAELRHSVWFLIFLTPEGRHSVLQSNFSLQIVVPTNMFRNICITNAYFWYFISLSLPSIFIKKKKKEVWSMIKFW